MLAWEKIVWNEFDIWFNWSSLLFGSFQAGHRIDTSILIYRNWSAFDFPFES